MIFNMAAPNWVKLKGIIWGMRENVLTKDFFLEKFQNKKVNLFEGPVGFVKD